MSERLRLAYFTPLPPQHSGIADYSGALLPHLAKHVAVDVFVDAPEQAEACYQQQFSVRPIAEFLARSGLRWRYDICLYHMGSQALYHEQIYEALVRNPGIVVLHEIDLSGFYMNHPASGGGPAFFIREMGYAYGLPGTQVARAIVYQGQAFEVQEYPLFNRIATISRGIIVHTRAARTQILEGAPDARVIHIPLAAPAAANMLPPNKPDWLAQLPADAIVLGSFGYIAPSKRIDVVLRALARVQERSPELYYVLVGEPVDQCDLLPAIRELGLEHRVHITGFVDSATFEAYLGAIDIGVNLRTGPSHGEMSASVVRLLAAGRPTIVSDVDGFAELPSDCVIKIKQDEDEIDQLAAALRQLIDDAAVRARYGAAARRYAEHELAFPRIAAQYASFIQECLS